MAILFLKTECSIYFTAGDATNLIEIIIFCHHYIEIILNNSSCSEAVFKYFVFTLTIMMVLDKRGR